MEKEKTVYVLITGRVQGVSFRYGCRRVAVDSDVSGFVRNLKNGQVEAVLRGKPENVERVIAWCHEGTDDAIVDDVYVEPHESDELFGVFTIRH